MTNLFIDWFLSNARQAATTRWKPPGLKLEQLHPLFSARAELIEGAYDHIESVHGSLDAYLQGPVGLTPADLEAIRRNLLVA